MVVFNSQNSMFKYFPAVFSFFCLFLFVQCKNEKKIEVKQSELAVPLKLEKEIVKIVVDKPQDINIPEGMVWVSGGTFQQGAVEHDKMAMQHEKPNHPVSVDGFFIGITEVTNDQFSKFVKETGYVTIAERAIDWDEMKKQLPAGTPKPHDSILQPGALVFKKTKNSVPNLYDFSQWWEWKIGANWKHPNGPDSSIKGKGNFPVVQIAYDDANAYCKWAGSRLPTESEWERAVRGTHNNTLYSWGDDASNLSKKANTWEGEFPVKNVKLDGYESRAPVKSYPANDYGVFDMAGNVWEWTSDWYNTQYYGEISTNDNVTHNPKGANKSYVPNNPYAVEKVIKGGSFLCNASYCASYRVSSRMGTSLDSSSEHVGFRTVVSVEMIQKNK